MAEKNKPKYQWLFLTKRGIYGLTYNHYATAKEAHECLNNAVMPQIDSVVCRIEETKKEN